MLPLSADRSRRNQECASQFRVILSSAAGDAYGGLIAEIHVNAVQTLLSRRLSQRLTLISTTRPTSPKGCKPSSSRVEATDPIPERGPAPSSWRTIDAPDGSGEKLTLYDPEMWEHQYFMRGLREARRRRLKEKKF
jgi:hypothetical protein